jgi:hypothetical protein
VAEAWPGRIETVDLVEPLTPAPIAEGSRVRLKQPKLPEGRGHEARRRICLSARAQQLWSAASAGSTTNAPPFDWRD